MHHPLNFEDVEFHFGGARNSLIQIGGSVRLCLDYAVWIQWIRDNVQAWHHFALYPAHYRPMAEIMHAVQYERHPERNRDGYIPPIPVDIPGMTLVWGSRLDGNRVKINWGRFVLFTLKRLAEMPLLDIDPPIQQYPNVFRMYWLNGLALASDEPLPYPAHYGPLAGDEPLGTGE